MKYVTPILFSFVIALVSVVVVRALALSKEAQLMALEHSKADLEPTHKHIDFDKKDNDKETGDKNGSDPKPNVNSNDNGHTENVDLNNAVDPVNDETIEGEGTLIDLDGHRVHFSNEKSRKKFKIFPWKYLQNLSLEPVALHEWKLVDQSNYEDVAPEICPVMGMEIDVSAGVYILHRGFKIHF